MAGGEIMEENKKGKKGLKMFHFNAVMSVFMVLLCVLLLYTTVVVSHRYDRMMESTEDYILWNENAAVVHEASDYLTEQVRLFAHTGDRQYMENYFMEVYVDQRRDIVLKEVHDYYADPETAKYLEEAVEESRRLMNQEYYAMKLICIASELPEMYIPPEIDAVELKTADAALSTEQMLQKGKMLLYDEEYRKSKEMIYEHLDHFVENVLIVMKEQQQDSADRFFDTIIHQRIFTGILILLNLITFAGILLMITIPLRHFSKRIRERTLLDVAGVQELRELAYAYNEMYDNTMVETTEFRYTPEKDPLTGVMSQTSYKEICTVLQENQEPMALALFTIDQFKWLRETYGKETCDWVMKKTAAILSMHLKEKSYLFRVAQDEFAVIFMNMTRKDTRGLEKTFEDINWMIQNPPDDLPPYTLSAGVAFSPEGWHRSLPGKAHEAQYQARRAGQKRIRFYKG